MTAAAAREKWIWWTRLRRRMAGWYHRLNDRFRHWMDEGRGK